MTKVWFLFLTEPEGFAINGEQEYFNSHFPELSLFICLVEFEKAHRSMEIIFHVTELLGKTADVEFEPRPKSKWD